MATRGFHGHHEGALETMKDTEKRSILTADLEDALMRGDEEMVQAALHDLLLYKSVRPLAPADLDRVVTVLDRGGRAARTALQILHASAARHGTLPADRETAATRLRAVLDHSREERTAVRLALPLLAALGDDQAVIECLTADGEQVHKEDYLSSALVPALTRHDAELAALQAALGGRAADEVRVIREYARDPAAYEAQVRQIQDDEVEVL